jgi:putative endopeptidase
MGYGRERTPEKSFEPEVTFGQRTYQSEILRQISMRMFRYLTIVLLLAALAVAQTAKPATDKSGKKASTAKKSTAKSAPAEKPAAPPKKPAGFTTASLDTTADPCADFYQYSCGGWLKNNPIPADKAAWGRFNELTENNRAALHDILEKAARPGKRTANQQKIGDYYLACMNETAINKAGLGALKMELDQINLVTSKSGLAWTVARLHHEGVPVFFDMGSAIDFKDANNVIAVADQSGLALPERDYYLKTDAKSVEIQKAYVEHLTNMFKLMGDAPEKAAAEAQTVMTIETNLAKGSMEVTLRREPANIYHKLTVEEWQALFPSFSVKNYLSPSGKLPFSSLNVTNPDFFKTVEAELKRASLDDLKTYFRWHLVHTEAAVLPTAFAQEDFSFFGRTLNGQKEQEARWKRCSRMVDRDLGEALGQVYVEKYFPKEAKDRILKLVYALEGALRQDIRTLPWMSQPTKQQALVKLAAIENKIGYPDHWRDYSRLQTTPDDALGNTMRSAAFEFQRQMGKIGKPPDRREFGMTPPTVNAYYNPSENNVNFPAGILQPPFFDFKADDGLNYGAIGAGIGHELTHGFDDSGRQFDAKGNLRDWWTAEDAKAFNERAQCIVDEYSGFTAVDDVKINGKLTLGENTADNGGLRIADMALLSTLSAAAQKEKIDGFTPEQRLFLGWGQLWCENQSPEAARNQTLTNSHALGKFRVNGVVRNMPEFRRAWGCKAGAPMAPENACRVW